MLTEAQAAMLAVNPATAYRLLKVRRLSSNSLVIVMDSPQDFVPLKKGDWIVQNGANSAAGTAIIQLCKAWGYQSINVRWPVLSLRRARDRAQIIRDRPDIDALRGRLRNLGATHVLTTSELENKSVKQRIKDITSGAPVRLGLNCVSGPSTTQLASRILTQDATLGVSSTFIMSCDPSPKRAQ